MTAEWAAIVGGADRAWCSLVVLVVDDRAPRPRRRGAARHRRALPSRGRARARGAARRRCATPTSSSTGSTPSSRGAERVTGRVDAASGLADRTFTSPVVKAMAVGTGTKRAVQRLRRRPDAGGRAGARTPSAAAVAERQSGRLMFKRATWLTVGFGLGVGTTVAAARKVRKQRRPLQAERDRRPRQRRPRATLRDQLARRGRRPAAWRPGHASSSCARREPPSERTPALTDRRPGRVNRPVRFVP